MPGAQCTRSLVCALVLEYAHEYSQRRHRKHPAFPTRWFYGLYRALPGDRAFLPPSSLRSLLPKNLAPASGRQDHASSPSATTSLVVALSLLTLPRPPHPALNVRDDREAPL